MINNAHAQVPNEDPKYKVTPTADKNSPSGIYIPENLDDCFQELEKTLQQEFLKEFKAKKEEELIVYHRGLGMWLRNNWGLWGDSRLKLYFNHLGVYHPDDMSQIIIVSFWRRLNNKPIQLEEQIKYYQDYWKEQKKKNK